MSSPWWRDRPSASSVFLAIIALAVTIPAVEHEVERFQRGRAVEAHVEAGDHAIAASDYQLATAAYSRAIEINPGDPRLLRLRARARAYVVADNPEAARPEDLAELRYDTQTQLEADPEHAAAYLCARAVALAQLGDREGAHVALEAALKRDPGSAIAHFAMAERLAAEGKQDEAKKHYEAALERRPNHVGSLVGLGALEIAAGKVDQGIGRLQAALAQRDDLATRLSLVDALVKKGSNEEALASAQRAAAAHPQAAESHRSLGFVYGLLNRLPDAERELRLSLAIRPTAQAYLDLASILGQQGRSKEALASFKRALREDSLNPAALLGASIAAEQSGLPEEAIDFLNKLVALPREGNGQEQLSSLQETAQKRLDAIKSSTPAASASAAPAGSR